MEFRDEDIVLKGRLQPGKMFLADLKEGRILLDEEIKERLAKEYPYKEWVENQKINLDDLP